MNISVLNDCEQGYIVGAFVGDGSKFAEKESGHYGAKFAFDAKRDEEIASFLRDLFVKTGKRVSLYNEESCLILKVYCQKFLRFLLTFVGYVEFGGKKRKTLIDYGGWPLPFKSGFISGLIDTDGYVHRNRRGTGHYGLSITTMNDVLKNQIMDIFESLGLAPRISRIKPGKNSYNKRATYIVRLPKPEFYKICRQLISIKHRQSGCETKSF